MPIDETDARLLAAIADQGGMMMAQETGWADRLIDAEALRIHKEIEAGQRTVVGVNRGVSAADEEREMEVQEVPEAEVRAHVERLRRFKEGRDKKALETALTSLREQVAGRATNLFPAAMEAIEAGATLPRGQVALNVEAADNQGVKSVAYFIDANLVGTAVAAPYQVVWASVPGNHVLRAVAIDEAGNRAESEEVAFRVP